FGNRNDLAQFLKLLNHHDDLLAKFCPQQCHFDETGILIAVANNQAAHLALHRQSGEQLRLAAYFEAEIERLAGIQNFFHHFAKLVHLDRKHTAIFTLIIELRNRITKCKINEFDTMTKNILKTDQQQKLEITSLNFLNNIG